MAFDDDDADDLGLDYEPLERRSGRIAFAVIEALTLPATLAPREELRKALIPGTKKERHGRLWRIGQVRSEGRSIVGRIGFQAGNIAEVWDDEINDFREAYLPAGTTSPFAIDPGKMRVAFQLRPGVIRVNSFTGALQALMNEASPVDRWRVSAEVEAIPFPEWVGTLDRVVRLRVRLRRPNPHYGGRQRVREIVEGANARMAQIVWMADNDQLDGIDVGDPFIREALDHADRYGNFAATGERAGRRSAWGSDQEAAAEERQVEADPTTREVPAETLRQELGDSDDAPEPELEPRGGEPS